MIYKLVGKSQFRASMINCLLTDPYHDLLIFSLFRVPYVSKFWNFNVSVQVFRVRQCLSSSIYTASWTTGLPWFILNFNLLNYQTNDFLSTKFWIKSGSEDSPQLVSAQIHSTVFISWWWLVSSKWRIFVRGFKFPLTNDDDDDNDCLFKNEEYSQKLPVLQAIN